MVLVLNLGKIHDLCNLGPNPRIDPYELKFRRSEENRGQTTEIWPKSQKTGN